MESSGTGPLDGRSSPRALAGRTLAGWALALGLLAASACGQASRGAAVLVRWRLWDATVGTEAAACVGAGARSPSFCCKNLGDRGDPRADITVDHLRLRAEIVADDGTLTDYDCKTCCFPCYPNEKTTSYELPPNRYKLSLEAYSCGRLVGHTPAPLVRTLAAGDVANLEVQAIALQPSDATDADGGAYCPTGPAPDAGQGCATDAAADSSAVAAVDAGSDGGGGASVDLGAPDASAAVDAGR